MSNTPQIRFAGFTDAWEQRKLSEISEKVSKKNQDMVVDEVFTNSAEFGIISQRDYFDKDIANSENIDGYYIVEPNDFVYNPRISTLAPFGPVRRNKLDKSGAMSPLYYVFRTHDVDCGYLEYFFKTNRWHSFMHLNGNSGARSDRFAIRDEVFRDMPISMPQDIVEQKKVGDFFSTLELAITLHQRKCDALQKFKKSMLQKMFPQNGESVPEIRFAGFTDAWEQRKLGECVTFLDTMRKPLKESEREKGIYPYYGASGIVDYVSDYIFDEELVLLSEDGANITDRNYPVCFLASGKYWVNNHAHVLKVNAENENNFICNSLERMDFTQYNSGMAMPKLNKDVCHNIPLFCPIYEEQKQIGDFFRNLDSLITLHQRKLETLQKMKKSLLQKMFV